VSGFTPASRPSPNHGPRRPEGIDILLLHYTGMHDADGALAWLCSPRSEVSCHYFVHEDGRILRLVDEARRAWHAGAGSWAGEEDVNGRSIGIEIANPGHLTLDEAGLPPPFADAQIEALIGLCRDILSRQAIPPRRVLAHSDTAPGRKTDPGERFPWGRLAAAGVGHWVEPEPIRDGARLAEGDEGEAVLALQALLSLYGYGLDVTGCYDARTAAVVTAFQRHFRPARVDGIADPSTRLTLRRLIAALP
jgi:N-acetylmuramoyl-L-alanine amidase